MLFKEIAVLTENHTTSINTKIQTYLYIKVLVHVKTIWL
jgi:hypothetical protein